MSNLADTLNQHLVFALGKETFAVGITPIREIIEYIPPTRIPLTPDFLRGVINVRGMVVPVIDISVRFGHGQTQAGRRSCIVIIDVVCEGETHALGFMVDAVKEVLDVQDDQIEPRPEYGLCMPEEFVTGLIRIEGGFIIILDIARVLSPDELSELIEVTTNAELAAHSDAIQDAES